MHTYAYTYTHAYTYIHTRRHAHRSHSHMLNAYHGTLSFPDGRQRLSVGGGLTRACGIPAAQWVATLSPVATLSLQKLAILGVERRVNIVQQEE